MSAFAKPLLIPSTGRDSSLATAGTGTPVNVDMVISFEKKDFPAIGNQTAKYQIAFYTTNGNKFWHYTTAAIRDAEFGFLKTLIGTAVPTS